MTTVVRSFAAAGRSIAIKADRFSAELVGLEQSGALAAGKLVEASVQGFMGGTSITMSGVTSKDGTPAKVTTRVVPTGRAVLVGMKGPAHLLERDVQAHEVAPGFKTKITRKGTLSDTSTGSSDAMRVPWDSGWRTGPFHHPGTQGKHFFAKGVAAARPQVEKHYERGVQAGAKRSFGVG